MLAPNREALVFPTSFAIAAFSAPAQATAPLVGRKVMRLHRSLSPSSPPLGSPQPCVSSYARPRSPNSSRASGATSLAGSPVILGILPSPTTQSAPAARTLGSADLSASSGFTRAVSSEAFPPPPRTSASDVAAEAVAAPNCQSVATNDAALVAAAWPAVLRAAMAAADLAAAFKAQQNANLVDPLLTERRADCAAANEILAHCFQVWSAVTLLYSPRPPPPKPPRSPVSEIWNGLDSTSSSSSSSPRNAWTSVTQSSTTNAVPRLAFATEDPLWAEPVPTRTPLRLSEFNRPSGGDGPERHGSLELSQSSGSPQRSEVTPQISAKRTSLAARRASAKTCANGATPGARSAASTATLSPSLATWFATTDVDPGDGKSTRTATTCVFRRNLPASVGCLGTSQALFKSEEVVTALQRRLGMTVIDQPQQPSLTPDSSLADWDEVGPCQASQLARRARSIEERVRLLRDEPGRASDEAAITELEACCASLGANTTRLEQRIKEMRFDSAKVEAWKHARAALDRRTEEVLRDEVHQLKLSLRDQRSRYLGVSGQVQPIEKKWKTLEQEIEAQSKRNEQNLGKEREMCEHFAEIVCSLREHSEQEAQKHSAAVDELRGQIIDHRNQTDLKLQEISQRFNRDAQRLVEASTLIQRSGSSVKDDGQAELPRLGSELKEAKSLLDTSTDILATLRCSAAQTASEQRKLQDALDELVVDVATARDMHDELEEKAEAENEASKAHHSAKLDNYRKYTEVIFDMKERLQRDSETNRSADVCADAELLRAQQAVRKASQEVMEGRRRLELEEVAAEHNLLEARRKLAAANERARLAEKEEISRLFQGAVPPEGGLEAASKYVESLQDEVDSLQLEDERRQKIFDRQVAQSPMWDPASFAEFGALKRRCSEVRGRLAVLEKFAQVHDQWNGS